MATQLLIDEPPLQVLPSLAEAIGLNEAIFIQQLHYWLEKSNHHDDDGQPWIYNTYTLWHQQFPFWGLTTLRRIIRNVEQLKLVESTRRFNDWNADNTKWYTINYEALSELAEDVSNVDRGGAQSGQG